MSEIKISYINCSIVKAKSEKVHELPQACKQFSNTPLKQMLMLYRFQECFQNGVK